MSLVMMKLSHLEDLDPLVHFDSDSGSDSVRNYCISTAFDPSLKQLAQQRDKVREQMEASNSASGHGPL